MSSTSKIGLGFEIKSNNEVLSFEEEMNFFVFKCSKEDSIGKPSYSRFTETMIFKGVPHPLKWNYTPKPQEEIDDSLYVYVKDLMEIPLSTLLRDESESLSESNEISKSRLEVTNEKDVSAPKSKEVAPSCVSHIKTPRQPLKDNQTHKVNRKNWNDMMERELGEGLGGLFNTGNGVAKPVWTNANRINHSNKFVPRSVQLNAGRPKFNSVRPNINTAVPNKPQTSLRPQKDHRMNQINQRRDFSKPYSSTSASYNWRNSRPNFNYNSGPTFIRTVNAKGPQGRPKPVKPDLWIVVLRIGKLQGIGEFSGVGFISTRQMELTFPEQRALCDAEEMRCKFKIESESFFRRYNLASQSSYKERTLVVLLGGDHRQSKSLLRVGGMGRGVGWWFCGELCGFGVEDACVGDVDMGFWCCDLWWFLVWLGFGVGGFVVSVDVLWDSSVYGCVSGDLCECVLGLLLG
ncbi:hypothetical protein Tco_0801177 [Tanacetum coccineum]|uniref:DCD domain-containing protein n=1 Tax=Tanacetum coccineum TaxID=301880 RepID=A0ABQ4ZV93_9ASTR